MGKGKKVVIVGLPRFASKLAAKLIEYYPEARIKSFDTYTSTIDKILSIPHLIFCDVVYSINGTITKSTVFDIAFLFKKKLIMHWVGTDVVRSVKDFKSGKYNPDYISKSVHLCEVEWMKEELKEMGIDAKIQNFVGFESTNEIPKAINEFNVLSYLHPGREEFYGIEKLITCAEKFPEIPFYITGSEDYEKQTPANMKFFGWVNNLDQMISEAGICVRIPEHDGLSSFVLESMSRGKFIAYAYDYPHCVKCTCRGFMPFG